ncbi:MAG: diaminopimelate decarboxylase [Thermoprotei archaeon]
MSAQGLNSRLMPPLDVDDGGSLVVGGISVSELAQRFGTPLFVTDEARLRHNYRRLKSSFEKWYPKFRVNYAVKANNNLSILSVLRQEGAGADCSDIEEVTLALMAGFTPEKLLYTGNYNSDSELRQALDADITINLDDVELLPRLLRIGVPERLSFRVNPGVGAGSHPGLVVGGANSKFGVEEGRVLEAYRRAKEGGVKRFGVHMMTGSNVLREEYFVEVTSKLLDIAERVAGGLGIEFEFVDIGGGFGVPYKPGETPLNIEEVGRRVGSMFRERVGRGVLGEPELMVEPGRFLVADTTVLVGRVHHVKHTSGRVFVGTDIGMNTLIRPMLYGAYHHIYVAHRPLEHPTQQVTVTGQICENTDVLAADRPLPPVEVGDLIVVTNAGAYGFSMSSQYNTRPRAAEVLVNHGEAELIRERETVFDLVYRQRVPARLLK